MFSRCQTSHYHTDANGLAYARSYSPVMTTRLAVLFDRGTVPRQFATFSGNRWKNLPPGASVNTLCGAIREPSTLGELRMLGVSSSDVLVEFMLRASVPSFAAWAYIMRSGEAEARDDLLY